MSWFNSQGGTEKIKKSSVPPWHHHWPFRVLAGDMRGRQIKKFDLLAPVSPQGLVLRNRNSGKDRNLDIEH